MNTTAASRLIYGNYDRVRAEGFINVPIADGLAFRVAGAVDRHDAYYKSVVSKTRRHRRPQLPVHAWQPAFRAAQHG